MIIKEHYLEDWDWYVKVFYAIDNYYIDQILGDLESIGCTGYELIRAENNLMPNKYNNGLIYSNLLGRCSIIVIGLTSSEEELKNICNCEKRYLCNHISKSLNINKNNKEFKNLLYTIEKQIFK